MAINLSKSTFEYSEVYELKVLHFKENGKDKGYILTTISQADYIRLKTLGFPYKEYSETIMQRDICPSKMTQVMRKYIITIDEGHYAI